MPAVESVGTTYISSGLTYQDAPVGRRYVASAQYLPTMNDGAQDRKGVQVTTPANKKVTKPTKRAPSGRRRLKDETLENLAGRIYQRVNCRSADPALHISLAVARKLVSRYNRADIEKALRLLEGRRNIAKPAGFFITVLRSEAKRAARDQL